MMCNAGLYKNIFHAFQTIVEKEGPRQLVHGVALNWVKLAPAAGLSFYTYELAKETLGIR